MKKNFLLSVLVVLFSAGTVFAQELGAYADFAIPTKENAKSLVGIGLDFKFEITDGFNAGALVGYRNALTSDYNYFQIPFMGLARYYVNRSEDGFYPQIALGGMYNHTSVTVLGQKVTSSSTNFAMDFGVGYKISDFADLSVHFENIFYKNTNVNYVLIRYAYSF